MQRATLIPTVRTALARGAVVLVVGASGGCCCLDACFRYTIGEADTCAQDTCTRECGSLVLAPARRASAVRPAALDDEIPPAATTPRAAAY